MDVNGIQDVLRWTLLPFLSLPDIASLKSVNKWFSETVNWNIIVKQANNDTGKIEKLLKRACKSGCIGLLKAIFPLPFSIDQVQLCLPFACQSNQENIVRCLLEGIAPSSIEIDPICWEYAAQYCSLNIVRLLEEASSRTMPLYCLDIACRHGNIPVVRYLTTQLGYRSTTAIWAALFGTGNVEVIDLLNVSNRTYEEVWHYVNGQRDHNSQAWHAYLQTKVKTFIPSCR